jgi:CRP-like cAMP-binding protein
MGEPRTTDQGLLMRFRNQLLAALPDAERAHLTPQLTRVRLEQGHVIYDPERPIETVCFPETAVVSLLSAMSDGSAVETATVGYEAMVGLAVFHGVDVVAEQAFVQVAGEVLLMPAHAFREALPHCPTLVQRLHRVAVALYTLAAQSSGCNRKHAMEQRCARWLLLVHDRVEGDRFDLTQAFLSQMLGVRRATVTVAAGRLQKAGLIGYSRGRITVLDRAGLERTACECYAIIRSAFDRLLGDGEARPSPLAGVRFSEDGMSTAKDGAPVEASAAWDDGGMTVR